MKTSCIPKISNKEKSFKGANKSQLLMWTLWSNVIYVTFNLDAFFKYVHYVSKQYIFVNKKCLLLSPFLHTLNQKSTISHICITV